MRVLLLSVAAACLGASSSLAFAIDQDGRFTIRGVGSGEGSCGEYVRASVEQRRWYEHWLMGYVTGINHARRGKADFGKNLPAMALVQWVENYCKANPLEAYSSAAQRLLENVNSASADDPGAA